MTIISTTSLLKRLWRNIRKISELRYESAMFTGWEQAKADAALEILPQQWETLQGSFCTIGKAKRL